jgi:hypothetical protein
VFTYAYDTPPKVPTDPAGKETTLQSPACVYIFISDIRVGLCVYAHACLYGCMCGCVLEQAGAAIQGGDLSVLLGEMVPKVTSVLDCWMD